MNQYNRRQQVLVVVVIIVLFLTLSTIFGIAEGDGPGKKHDPLPPQSNGCDSNGKGPEHKCNQPESQPTAVATEVKAQPTEVPIQPTAQPTKKVTKSAEPTVLPQVTAQPSATAAPVLTSCSDEVCSPCEFLEDALADGMMVIIVDRDRVEVYEDMSLRIPGQFDLLATGLLSQSGYGN